MITQNQDELKKQFDAIREKYAQGKKRESLNVLLFGLYGSGKTTILRTARKPILLAMFDPGGEKVLRKEIAEGSVLVLDYTSEERKKPTEYMRWEKDFEAHSKSGLLDNVGSYCIDSLTTWFQCLMNAIVARKNRDEGQPAIQDWGVAKNVVIDMIKRACDHDCDFFLTAHMTNEKDELTGEILSDLNAFKSLRPLLPILFDEKWITESTKSGPDKTKYQLKLESSGRYRASSRIKGQSDKIKSVMEPDIKAILKLADFDVSDKPNLFGESK